MRLPQPRSPAGAKSCTPDTWGYRAAATAAWASSTVLRWGNTRPYTPVSNACLITHWSRSRAFGGIRTIGTTSGCRLPFFGNSFAVQQHLQGGTQSGEAKTLVFHFNDDRVVVGISNVSQVIQTAVRDCAGAENRLAVLKEVDDLVVAHFLSHVFPLRPNDLICDADKMARKPCSLGDRLPALLVDPRQEVSNPTISVGITCCPNIGSNTTSRTITADHIEELMAVKCVKSSKQISAICEPCQS